MTTKELTPEQVAARAAKQAARKAAREAARRAAVLARQIRAEDLAEERRVRQALRKGVHMDMTGWVTLTGDPLPADAEGVTLPLTRGFMATRDPAINGVVVPAVRAMPGESYVATCTGSGNRSYLGLQWVNADGTTNPGILWAKVDGRTSITGVAPDTARGVRALLVCYSVQAADLAGKDIPTKVAMQNLRQWIIANRPAGEA